MPGVSGIIEREIELISRFVAVLNEELESLKQGNADALPKTTAAKDELVEALNALEVERMAAIGLSAGKPNDHAAMEVWLAQHASDTNATVNWKKLLILAREAKILHQLNGGLIAMHLRNANEIMSILTQQANKPGLYGASGQAVPVTGSRIVDSA
jgi:flagellar biosynthesis/type III secretory pathway chaperone